MNATLTTPPLIVFDLDGTIANTAVDLVATLNALLTREGLKPIPFKDALGMVGAGAKALIQRGLKANDVIVDEKRLDELFSDYIAHYEEHIADESVLYPGVLKALDRFEAAGWSFAICTNKLEGSSRLLLTALGVAGRFKAICGKDTFAVSKPDGEALLRTIAKAGGDPRRAVMVGDSRADVDAAHNARVPVVAVDFGYSDLPVETFEPDRIISHFDELFDAVEELSSVFHVA